MRIYVAGHQGMVGSAIMRKLVAQGECDLITATRAELDLTDQSAVRRFFKARRPDVVIIAAAKVGGIMANNTYPADFIYDNLMITTNLIQAAHASGVARLLNMGSSCIYPRDARQPIKENALLVGALEPTNEPYAIAKIAGIKLCESYNRQYGTDYRAIMPANLYGPGDNFHPEHAHVLPSLIKRFHDAVETGADQVTIWGTGKPRREFLHVDDLAAAALHVLKLDHATYADHTALMCSHINVGTGQDISILDLARLVAEITGFKGSITCDTSRPDGTMRKLMDVSRLAGLGWTAQIDLRDGIAATYNWYRSQVAKGAVLRAS